MVYGQHSTTLAFFKHGPIDDPKGREAFGDQP